MPALKLMRAVSAYSADSFDVTYGFPNDKAKMVVVRGGFKVLGETKRHVRVLRHAAYASRLKDQPNVPKAAVWAAERGAESLPLRVAAAAFDAVKLASHPLELFRARTQYELLWTSRFDDRFDRLWEKARGEYDIVGERTSKFLNWRCPKVEIATLVRRGDRSREVLGYCLLEEKPKDRWHILDMFGLHAELEPLLDLLLVSLWWRGAVNVSIGFLGAPKVASLVASRGFVSREEPRTIVVLPGKTHPDGASLTNKDRWHLFAIDEDT